MKLREVLLFSGIVAASLTAFSCAPYSELKPKPLPIPSEGDYIPLKRSEKDFELKKNGKYFIAFPAPQEDNSYLVLNMPDKKKAQSYFTGTMVDGKKPGTHIKDESPYPDTQSAYPVGIGSQSYYLIIENGPTPLNYRITYRYAPRWRFRFETRYTVLNESFAKNLVDRSTYNALAPGYDIESLNHPLVMDTVGKHTASLESILKELLEIESLFPQKLVNSQDPAYLNYVSFKKELEGEIAFQKAYHLTIDFFYKELQTRKNAFEFVTRVDDFIAFYQQKATLSQGALDLANATIKKRTGDIVAAYDQRLNEKADAKPFEGVYYRIENYIKLATLTETAGITMPPDLGAQYRFIVVYQKRALSARQVRDSIAQIAAFVKGGPQMPPDDFFGPVVARAESARSLVPQPLDASHGRYQALSCAGLLNQDVAVLGSDVVGVVENYRAAQGLVPQLNVLKMQREYSQMLGLLKQNAKMTFLHERYKELDKMSITEQAGRFRTALEGNAWGQAENTLRAFHADQNYLDPASMPQKAAVVNDLEDSLYIRIERVTRNRVMKFLDERVNQLTNIDSLYADSAFIPAYDVTFSSGGKRELIQRKEQLIADLARFRENEFPMRAVKLLYDQFMKNPIDSGVYRARAIVAHGTKYTGDDKDTKIRIAECDPSLAKWITKPKEYRRVFALPLTDNDRKGAKNRYMVRLNVRIPTDAQFPVYDVNIKLPKEIAENAATEQWYEAIKLNRKELKNEGRFSIGAPTASNSYECQITPVQMDKDGNNIFEITFNYPAFKVFPVSIMVQKPIIKKN